jgi:biopolymer transport protein ExbD
LPPRLVLAKEFCRCPGARDNQLKINEDTATWDNLGLQLGNIFKLRAEKAAFVKGDDTVVFADVARAIDVMRNSGVERVGLMLAGQ